MSDATHPVVPFGIGDASHPSGAVAVRLSDPETAALLDAVEAAVERTCAAADAEAERTAWLGELGVRAQDAEDRDVLLSAARKLWSLLGDDVAGLEIRVVRR